MLACLLENTPHFEVASSFLSGQPKVERYREYIDYAIQFYTQPASERHSLDRFLTNLDSWKHDFDLENHPIDVGVRSQ